MAAAAAETARDEAPAALAQSADGYMSPPEVIAGLVIAAAALTAVVLTDPAGIQTLEVPAVPPEVEETAWQHEPLVVQTVVPVVVQPFLLSAMDMVKEDFIY